MKNIILILVALSLTSCVLTKKQQTRFLAKHCVGSDSTSVSHDVIFKDTTIFITKTGPIQYLENPCKKLCDSLGNLKPFQIKEKKNGLIGTIKSVGNSIVFDCEADSLKAVIKVMQHEKSTYKKEVKIVKEYCEKEHRNKFDGFTYWWFFISAGILLIVILFKIFKGYIKTAFPFLNGIIK